MGQVVRKTAAAGTILGDLLTAYTNAVAKKGDWETTAEARIGPTVVLVKAVQQRLKEAADAAAPMIAELDALNQETDDLVGRIADSIWNDVGRPASDPALDILYPGGISHYTDGPVEQQPVRMELLAELVESGIHPKLEAAKATDYATQIRQAGVRLQEKVDAARPLKERVELVERMQQAIARSAAVSLARLKAAWKADGKTEAEIHTVIPDRPTKSKSTKKTDPSGE